MNTLRIKKGDTVIVLSGKEKGKKGTVVLTNPAKQTVTVEGVNLVKCHTKPKKQGEVGGIIEKEAALRLCKVQLFCKACNKGTRIAYKIENGEKIRVCKHCNKEV